MTFPHGADLGIPEHSPCHALYFAVRYLRVYERPTFIGHITTMMNSKLDEWHKPHSFMEGSVSRFFRPGHINSLPSYLPAGWRVICGKEGVKRGHVLLIPPGELPLVTKTARRVTDEYPKALG